MHESPNLNLPYLQPNQAQKHVTLNEALRRLDAVVQLSCESRAMLPPPDAAEGACYIVPASATGDWAGHADAIAALQDGAWAIISPKEGWAAWVRDEARLLVFTGAGWSPALMCDEVQRLGVGAAPDPAHALNVAGHSALFSHAGNSHRLVVNRAGPTDTASLIFQTGFAAGAEIGLAATNDLSVKIAAGDGTLATGLTLKAGTGFAGFGTDTPLMRMHLREQFDARLMIETAAPESGGGFDILNSGSGQRWRVTGQASLFKIRDHSAAIDKLTLNAGSSGTVLIENCGNVGIGTSSPTARLHVAGTIRCTPLMRAALPAAADAGAGCLAFVSDAPGGARFAYSDGAAWRWIADGVAVS